MLPAVPNPTDLREKAALCRRAAAQSTNGGHLEDLILLGIAADLERRAAELERGE